MQVTLAGYNIDVEIIDLLNKLIDGYPYSPEDTALEDLISRLVVEPPTPETLSAAYARISRSDKGIGELRRDARASISRARRTNEKVVFGFGHASVAEHAVINLDITGISRLALEELEAHRLASFTEASQRYIAVSGDFIIPQEVSDAGLAERFRQNCEDLFAGYRRLIALLEKYYTDLSEYDRNIKAREDSRYVLPLACRSQVGVTINARTAECMIRSFNRSQLAEVRELAQKMLTTIKRAIPSLMRYTEPNRSLDAAQEAVTRSSRSLISSVPATDEPIVELIDIPEQDVQNALAALLFNAGDGSYSDCLKAIEKMNEKERRELIISAHRCISAHDTIRRELELGYFTFSVALSSSAFAQFKRHRIATLIKQRYLPELGYAIPQSIVKAGGEETFRICMTTSVNLYNFLSEKLEGEHDFAKQYALTNAHRCRVIFQANARELTHFSRLRLDQSAQWDIRSIAHEMIQLAREKCPLLMLFAAGKDSFDKLSEELFAN